MHDLHHTKHMHLSLFKFVNRVNSSNSQSHIFIHVLLKMHACIVNESISMDERKLHIYVFNTVTYVSGRAIQVGQEIAQAHGLFTKHHLQFP